MSISILGESRNRPPYSRGRKSSGNRQGLINRIINLSSVVPMRPVDLRFFAEPLYAYSAIAKPIWWGVLALLRLFKFKRPAWSAPANQYTSIVRKAGDNCDSSASNCWVFWSWIPRQCHWLSNKYRKRWNSDIIRPVSKLDFAFEDDLSATKAWQAVWVLVKLPAFLDQARGYKCKPKAFDESRKLRLCEKTCQALFLFFEKITLIVTNFLNTIYIFLQVPNLDWEPQRRRSGFGR